MMPKSPVKLWTGPSDRRAPCGPWGQPVDNAGALPTACPHSRASRPRTSQDPQPVISGRQRRGPPGRLTSPDPGGRFNRRGHFIQPEYTLFPPSNCPTNQDHLPGRPVAVVAAVRPARREPLLAVLRAEGRERGEPGADAPSGRTASCRIRSTAVGRWRVICAARA